MGKEERQEVEEEVEEDSRGGSGCFVSCVDCACVEARKQVCLQLSFN